MDDDFIIAVFVAFAERCETILGKGKYRPKMDAAEIMTVSGVTARYFNEVLLTEELSALKKNGSIAIDIGPSTMHAK